MSKTIALTVLESRDCPADLTPLGGLSGLGGVTIVRPPAEYVWTRTGEVVGDSTDPANWLKGLVPPAAGARVRIPAGTAPMNEVHIDSLLKLTVAEAWTGTLVTDGLDAETVDIRGGTFVPLDDLVLGSGTVNPGPNGLTFDASYGGDVVFRPRGGVDLVIDGLGAGAVAYLGTVRFASAAGEVVSWHGVSWQGAAGGMGAPAPVLSIDDGGRVRVTSDSTATGTTRLDVTGKDALFTLDTAKAFDLDGYLTVTDGGAVVGVGARLTVAGKGTTSINGVAVPASVVVEGEGAYLWLKGNGAEVDPAAALVVRDTGYSAGLLLTIPTEGVDRVVNRVSGDLFAHNSGVVFSQTGGVGRLEVDGAVTLRASGLHVAVVHGGGSDLVRVTGGTSIASTVWDNAAVYATPVGVAEGFESWRIIDNVNGSAVTGVFGALDFPLEGAYLSYAPDDVYLVLE